MPRRYRSGAHQGKEVMGGHVGAPPLVACGSRIALDRCGRVVASDRIEVGSWYGRSCHSWVVRRDRAGVPRPTQRRPARPSALAHGDRDPFAGVGAGPTPRLHRRAVPRRTDLRGKGHGRLCQASRRARGGDRPGGSGDQHLGEPHAGGAAHRGLRHHRHRVRPRARLAVAPLSRQAAARPWCAAGLRRRLPSTGAMVAQAADRRV
jgi:hypothetical protein